MFCRRFVKIIIILFLLGIGQPNFVLAEQQNDVIKNCSDKYIEPINEVQQKDKGRIIIKYKNSNKSQLVSSAILKKIPNTEYKVLKKLNLSKLDIVEVDSEFTDEVISELKNDPNVEYAQLDKKYYSTSVPGDTYFSRQWGLNNSYEIDINVLSAWDLTKGDSNIVVGILDTGIDVNHTDLNSNIYINSKEIDGNNIDDDGNGFIDDISGWDFANDDNSVFDSSIEDKHATHVAGIIAANENSRGVVGVAPNIKIVLLMLTHVV